MKKYTVTIIGAGIAGIHAGKLLKERNIDFCILEASNYIGGRIRSYPGFSQTPIELGAEEVHGKRNIWYYITKEEGALPKEDHDLEDYIYWQNRWWSWSEFSKTAYWKWYNQLETTIERYKGPDETLKVWFEKFNIPQPLQNLANIFLGNEYGTSIDRVGIQSLKKYWNMWSSGEENYRLQRKSCSQIVRSHYEHILPHIYTNNAVEEIDYQNDSIEVSTQNGKTWSSDLVLITVPLPILKKGYIEFDPPLLEDKQLAIDTIPMGNGIKLFLKFRTPFWKEDTGSIYLPDSLIPEFWTDLDNENLLTGFVMGKNAEELQKAEIEAQALAALDKVYGGKASAFFAASHIMDWSKEPYIYGTYSYPAPNTQKARRILSRPTNDKLFWAGEASHTQGHFGTVHGAIETAERALSEIEEVLFKRNRRT